ncbi:Uncharacterized protein dnm_000470 [Desulfonema magnum]|uniref:Uncharacterized protein n=1 Tax=Desulfonema magnum TaxID=45655 RepID=A0A975BFE1_9BACT|nr:Uncharacterized protein dnm_000470 [Desulfonema magnum]
MSGVQCQVLGVKFQVLNLCQMGFATHMHQAKITTHCFY